MGLNDAVGRSSPTQIPGTQWDKPGPMGATKTDNTIWFWGHNTFGTVGDNSNVPRSSPIQIPGTWSLIDGNYTNLAIKTGT